MTKGEPGHRFQDRYAAGRKARRASTGGSNLRRLVRLIVAVGALAAGVVLVFIPGPAIVFFFLAGGLLASESKGVARALDWTEVRLRVLWSWGQRHWRKLPGWGRAGVAVLAVSIGTAGAYASYRLMVG